MQMKQGEWWIPAILEGTCTWALKPVQFSSLAAWSKGKGLTLDEARCPEPEEPEEPADGAEVPMRSEQQRSRGQVEELKPGEQPETLRQSMWLETEGRQVLWEAGEVGNKRSGRPWTLESLAWMQ